LGRIQLLDCTLRDGGYINDWRFGESAIKDITDKMVQSGVDIVEIGFLKNEPYQKDRCVFNSMEQVKKVIEKKKREVKYAVMCEVVNPLPLELLAPVDKDSADIIRVIIWKTKHDKQGNVVDALQEGFEYCKGIVEKGYKLCVQPARVSQYSDEEFVAMVKKFSTLNPLAIYVVDSWGTQNPEDLLHYMHLADENMPKNVSLGYHGHNNMMQALSAAQAMIHENFQRDIIIDASIYGIGRGAGNLNIEIIAKYMNEKCSKQYDIKNMLCIYENYIKDIYTIEPWGYSIPFYLTAQYDCNPSYARWCIKNKFSISLFENVLKELNDSDKIMYSSKILEDIRR
jgi:4-hydroxy 2-oxovalerate aldolase